MDNPFKKEAGISAIMVLDGSVHFHGCEPVGRQHDVLGVGDRGNRSLLGGLGAEGKEGVGCKISSKAVSPGTAFVDLRLSSDHRS